MDSYKLFQVIGGWTYVGRMTEKDSSRIVIQDVAIVHWWGTPANESNHDIGFDERKRIQSIVSCPIGPLHGGPTKNTILHRIPIVDGSEGLVLERRCVRFSMDIDHEKWATSLSSERISNGSRGVQAKMIQAGGGWTCVGKYIAEQDDCYVMTNVHVVHDWGTSEGLGAIVERPLRQTETYAIPSEVRFERASIHCIFNVSAAGWQERLGYDL